MWIFYLNYWSLQKSEEKILCIWKNKLNWIQNVECKVLQALLASTVTRFYTFVTIDDQIQKIIIYYLLYFLLFHYIRMKYFLAGCYGISSTWRWDEINKSVSTISFLLLSLGRLFEGFHNIHLPRKMVV